MKQEFWRRWSRRSKSTILLKGSDVSLKHEIIFLVLPFTTKGAPGTILYYFKIILLTPLSIPRVH